MRWAMRIMQLLLPGKNIIANADVVFKLVVNILWYLLIIVIALSALCVFRGNRLFRTCGVLLSLSLAVFLGIIARDHSQRYLQASNASSAVLTAPPQDILRVASFNLRGADIDDGPVNSWEPHRKHLACDTFHLMHADIVGTQEGHRKQLDFLSHCSPRTASQRGQWKWIGRTDGDHAFTADSAILYNSAEVQLLHWETLWLSHTPRVAGSKLADSALPRSATWALFQRRNNTERICFINTHLDHVGEHARTEQALLLKKYAVEACRSHTAALTVITGDFNTLRNTEPWNALTRHYPVFHDVTDASDKRHPYFSFHAFLGKQLEQLYYSVPVSAVISAVLSWLPSTTHIDWILVDAPAAVRAAEYVTIDFDGLYPSDHYPVYADIYVPS